MTVSQSKKTAVRYRANNCCEYCRLSATSVIVPFQIDHIIPLKHDGSDDSENLCLACYPCNAHKSHDLTGFDPFTGKITQLYNPRKKVWNEHFIIQADMQILGITAEGRTTVRVLRMNDEDRVEARQVFAELGEYPCMGDN